MVRLKRENYFLRSNYFEVNIAIINSTLDIRCSRARWPRYCTTKERESEFHSRRNLKYTNNSDVYIATCNLDNGKRTNNSTLSILIKTTRHSRMSGLRSQYLIHWEKILITELHISIRWKSVTNDKPRVVDISKLKADRKINKKKKKKWKETDVEMQQRIVTRHYPLFVRPEVL